MEDTSETLNKTITLGSDCDHSGKFEDVSCLKILINGQKYIVIPHYLMEVFSVRFMDHSDCFISGDMRIELGNGDYYLFGANKGDTCASSIEVDSQGYAILMPDSECPLDFFQHLVFYPHIEKLKGKVDGLRALGRKKKKRMNIPFWDNRDEQQGQTFHDDVLGPSDELVCKHLQTQAGPVEIAFAVFVDAIEAFVDVTLFNWRVEKSSEEPIKLYGNVTAESSKIRKPQAKSILLQRENTRNQYFCVYPSKQNGNGDHIPLPLSRRKVVHPRNSALTICVDIGRCFDDFTDDKSIAKGKVEFRTKPSRFSDSIIQTEDFKVIRAESFDIQVKVQWMHDTRISHE